MRRGLRPLRPHRHTLHKRFGVERLALFGSVTRDEAHAESDIDLLVRFRTAPGYDGYFALKCFLEEVLGKPVDLVMEGALRQGRAQLWSRRQ
ncbi:MAG: nucleotidyltransferase family protein [Fimbriimonadales bacterium]|nr:nucleotidyltransferase family protein [Fimbriimonadales bacterium]MDW8051485.1 nucleotidyltransferase family protein [Armatimonadota bacterium]